MKESGSRDEWRVGLVAVVCVCVRACVCVCKAGGVCGVGEGNAFLRGDLALGHGLLIPLPIPLLPCHPYRP